MEYKETTCSCRDCVKMCEDRPCWPIPEEAEKLINAGYADKLMLDYWVGGGPNDEDIHILGPATVGREGRHAPFIPYGRCTLLTDKGLCPLHDKGLKPFEGRMATCKEQDGIELHEYTAMTWNSNKGREVVARWQELMGLDR